MEMISTGARNGQRTDFMESMTAFGDDVRLFTGKTEAEAERFEADGALFLDVFEMVGGDDGDGGDGHGGQGGVVAAGGCSGGGCGGADGGGLAVCAPAEDGVEGLERLLGKGRPGGRARASEGGGERGMERGIWGKVMQQ